MKNADFVYVVVCHHYNDDNPKLKYITDVDSVHKTMRSAEIRCAEANRWVRNAKPNPEFKAFDCDPSQKYIRKDKNRPASWLYVRTMRIY